MSDDMLEVAQDHEARGISRRNALRAGAAVGVGAVAWSGVSITSLGGTPAYAEGCTFKSTFTLANCRNTDQGKCDEPPPPSHIDLLAYHPLDTAGLPNGYTLDQTISNDGVCCDSVTNPVFTFPTTVKCLVHFTIYNGNDCTSTGDVNYDFVYPTDGTPTDSGSITIDLGCPPQGGTSTGESMSNDFWSIVVVCNSKAAPDSCYSTT